MTDSPQYVTSATEAEITAIADADNALRGYPCCAVDCADDCPCDLHVYPDGRPAPHHGSHTLRQAEVTKHPDRAEWAYPVDAVLVDAVATAVESIAALDESAAKLAAEHVDADAAKQAEIDAAAGDEKAVLVDEKAAAVAAHDEEIAAIEVKKSAYATLADAVKVAAVLSDDWAARASIEPGDEKAVAVEAAVETKPGLQAARRRR